METIIYACIIFCGKCPTYFRQLLTKCNLEKLSTFLVIVIVYHLFVNGILVVVLIIVAGHLKF